MTKERELFEPEDDAAWRSWLADNHNRATGIWLVLRKKSAPVPNLSWPQAVRTALCFGWIDSTAGTLDEHRSILWVSPRRAGSWWSRINKQAVADLTEQGLIEPAGQAAIDRAHQDGTWTALDGVEAVLIPDDLAAAFSERPGSAQEFAAFPRGVRRGILEWIARAKRPQTRANRIAETATMAQQGERAHQWSKKP
ncbi:MAG: YdeI/OmpD-associated family protein [Ornithinimicrobium sp.]